MDPTNLNENSVIQTLHAIFVDSIKNPEKYKSGKKYSFTFFYKDTFYETFFDFIVYDGFFVFKNDCILITYDSSINEFTFDIHAETHETSCFHPLLEGGQLDVLVILATKICLSYPNQPTIGLLNIAEKNNIRISKSKLLRGLPTLYEKYGYINPDLTRALERFQRLQFESLSSELQELFTRIYRRPISKDEFLVRLMKDIPPSMENSENISSYPGFIESPGSEKKRLTHILYDFLQTKFGFPGLFELSFDIHSPSWERIQEKVQITRIQQIPIGGKRKTRRKRGKKHTRKNRK